VASFSEENSHDISFRPWRWLCCDSIDHGGGKRRRHSLTKNAKFRDRPADDYRTNEPKEKYADPSASNHVASNGAVDRTNERTEKYGEPSASNHVVSNDAEYSTDYSRDL
jgi:hypothetical protein